MRHSPNDHGGGAGRGDRGAQRAAQRAGGDLIKTGKIAGGRGARRSGAAPCVDANSASDGISNAARAIPTRVPDHVVILGLGPSCEAYVDHVKRLGGRHVYADEVWAINALGGVVQCDRIFHMDDVRIQEIRARARPQSNIARMLEWMRAHPGPIYTSRTHRGYPGLVEYPLQDVLNSCGVAYLNNTAAYAVAYAVHIGVKQISCFGMDYTYANAHDAEKGRACTEFHLGIAKARGIKIGLTDKTSLMDACEDEQSRLYGYDTLDVRLDGGGSGPISVSFVPRDAWPDAETIEARYDHSKHPSPLVKE